MSPSNKRRPAAAATASGPRKRDLLAGEIISPSIRRCRSAAQVLVKSISKGHATELRVLLTEWRNQRKVELRDYTAIIPGCYFPAGAGVTLPLDKLDELVDALKAVRL
jgi:hypothetical protein